MKAIITALNYLLFHSAGSVTGSKRRSPATTWASHPGLTCGTFKVDSEGALMRSGWGKQLQCGRPQPPGLGFIPSQLLPGLGGQCPSSSPDRAANRCLTGPSPLQDLHQLLLREASGRPSRGTDNRTANQRRRRLKGQAMRRTASLERMEEATLDESNPA